VLEEVDIRFTQNLDTYAADILLSTPVSLLRREAETLVPLLRGRTVWMVNSTARGGGVAEMLPKMVHLLRELGVDVRWVVISTARSAFFPLTKRLHNAIHGDCQTPFTEADRQLYEQVGLELADAMSPRLKPGDVLVIHDPQPAAMGAALRARRDITCIWRCHIGLERETAATQQAWEFLRPFLKAYDHSVFSDPAYIPPYLAKSVSIIQPAIDPLSHKNRRLHPVKLVGVLTNAGLYDSGHPVLTPAFDEPVKRLSSGGEFLAHDGSAAIGLLSRPTVTQISRWDKLKGWLPLLQGFRRLKQRVRDGRDLAPRSRRRLEICRLVLAGPDPTSVQDDPEALQALQDVAQAYAELSPELQRDIAVLSLPMGSLKHNALIVNALQRSSSLVVQNSLQEGFGLVVTEAMWKGTAVLGSSAYGIRQQIRHDVDGRLISDPSNPESVEHGLWQMLDAPKQRSNYASHARERVHKQFLVFRQLSDWLRLLANVEPSSPLAKAAH
jgi:trehalose synthase